MKSLVSLSEIEAFIPKKRNRKNGKSAHRRTVDFNRRKNLRKYKAKEVAYLKIDENILGNLSEILQKFNQSQKQKICF